MRSKSSFAENSYHHGRLREALLDAARKEIEENSYESLSLRDVAASVRVSEAAPYRHFADKRSLLAALAADGFRALEARALAAMAEAVGPVERMTAGARTYLAFAAERPQLFRLMFVSDLLTRVGERDSALVQVANRFHGQFEALVEGICPSQDQKSVKAASLAIWSLLHGFALLRIGQRLLPFMMGSLSDSELVDAILKAAIATPAATSFSRRRGSRPGDKQIRTHR
jgi:AcrR family transcriptional regulator